MVNALKQGNKEYFRILNIKMGNEPKNKFLTRKEKNEADLIGKNFFHYIMNQDIDTFDPEDIPNTKTRVSMIKNSTPPIQIFIYEH